MGPPGSAAVMLLADGWAREALIADVRAGLGRVPRSLPPRWLYDERGSELFEQITRLADYYPTEAERALLRSYAAEIVATSRADVVVELGAGTSDKTRTLLDAFTAQGALRRFIALDVSEPTLREAADALRDRYPGIEVTPVVGDFSEHLDAIPRDGRRLFAFLGGTVGNFTDVERGAFLSALARSMSPGEHLLLGADLVKSADRLIAAYNDASGLTEQFIRNALDVVNSALGADFDQSLFEYSCLWDPTRECVDMRLRSLIEQTVTIEGAGMTVPLARGEEISVETSHKFHVASLRSELAAAGLEPVRSWSGQDGGFALTLARRR